MATGFECAEGLSSAGEIRRRKILVIDDEPRVIDGIKRNLARLDVDVLEGYHGMQGIWRGITERPDVIITDIRMPHADGEEVIECLQHNPNTRAVPIIVLTGITDPKLEQRLRKRGAAAFFTKPVDFEELLTTLSNLLGFDSTEDEN